ncbi:hypothetical protein PP175_27150 (plasmid) [Aneurinibacillus sp. Ricciae_BoGa-3]|uniref:hypothetical protein n=1 Tax=Aneurinibacillus sp. Ricciae_BoGa-3 TaxID=3022697 RepID=UPI00233FC6F7|nr:hypothetical protein [Aneurinibacillus sp. Ricciae_BoGa-3]WCK57717.1 hypothetical protein PP175_27150 [Aneurinibacillus sp. Ricciae_BoGa-3]
MKNYTEHSSGRKKKDNNLVKFPDMAKRINQYLKEEDLRLDFTGYMHTIHRYFSMQEQDLYEVYHLMTECNLWSHYLSEVENFIQQKLLSIQMEVDRLDAYFDKKTPNESLDKAIEATTAKAKDFAVFHKQLMAQRILFEKGYWHCFKVYGKGINTLTYKSLD